MKEVVAWLMNMLFDLIVPVVKPMFENHPQLTKTMGSGVEIFAYLNYWVPLDYGFSLISSLFLIQAVFSGIKLILKLIPTVG